MDFMNKKISLLLVFLLAGQLVYAQKGKVISSLRPSALEKYAEIYRSGQKIVKESVLRRSLLAPKSTHPSKVSNERIFRDKLLMLETEILSVNMNSLYYEGAMPTREQVAQAHADYEQLFKEFEKFRQEVTPEIVRFSFSGFVTPLELQKKPMLISRISAMASKVEALRAVAFPRDLPLGRMKEYLDSMMRLLNPYHTTFVRHPRPDKRVYNESEFFLLLPRKPNTFISQRLTNPLPENIRLAVVNDEAMVADRYVYWFYSKHFPKGWDVQVYSSVTDCLNAYKRGEMFDLIITDLVVPGGGGNYLVDQLRQMNFEGAILGNSAYYASQIQGKENFDLGYDGYFSSGDVEVYDDLYDYLQTYYYYRDKNGWAR